MSKKVAIIIPYFGKFPNYFDFWLKSALENLDFDFLIFTDNSDYKSINNVHFIKITFPKFKSLLQKKVEFKICLNEPYKICDYRPLFGSALKEYIADYEFWGFGDVDLIYGKLNRFITPEILNKYDKIYELGHLTLLRNNVKCNNLWKIKHHLKNAYRYDEAFKTPYSCHFDETDGLTQIAKLEKINTYNNVDFADVDRSKYNFFLLGKKNRKEPGIFEWKSGNLFFYSKGYNKKIIKDNIAYVHLQKRKLSIPSIVDSVIDKSTKFMIVPNRFIFDSSPKFELSNQVLNSEYKYYKKNRKNEVIKKIRNHALQQRIYRFFIKYLYRKRLDKN
ncbi:hypothetical protein IMAU10142_01417 [Lactobacillus helveticus]|uniref:DUF6625 family protein n=1 Tax=Lactobacillus helveticus TaxID=1587 RepID=UPI0015636D23|nr:DUF6625 family protein [Lactobacillus helveticus]NRO91388.1 hypothetical protein [Lactobacillus helveticus]